MTTNPMLEVVAPVRQYLRGELPPLTLVRIIDDLVSDDLLADLHPAAAALVDDLQVALALYVPDEVSRREEPGALLGPVELLERVRQFDAEARRLGY